MSENISGIIFLTKNKIHLRNMVGFDLRSVQKRIQNYFNTLSSIEFSLLTCVSSMNLAELSLDILVSGVRII